MNGGHIGALLAGLTFSLAATMAHADPPLICDGVMPEWQLDLLSDNDARFQFAGRDQRFTIPQSTRAEGRDWPRAMTLVSRNDTAILVLDETTCTVGDDTYPMRLDILTQRGETPILLTGCCMVAE